MRKVFKLSGRVNHYKVMIKNRSPGKQRFYSQAFNKRYNNWEIGFQGGRGSIGSAGEETLGRSLWGLPWTKVGHGEGKKSSGAQGPKVNPVKQPFSPAELISCLPGVSYNSKRSPDLAWRLATWVRTAKNTTTTGLNLDMEDNQKLNKLLERHHVPPPIFGFEALTIDNTSKNLTTESWTKDVSVSSFFLHVCCSCFGLRSPFLVGFAPSTG